VTAVAAFGDDQEPVFDAEIVELPTRPAIPPPDRADPLPLPWATSSPDRRPVVPEWALNAEHRRQALRWLLGHVWHFVAFHSARLPLYTLRAIGRVPVGLWRMTSVIAAWVSDAGTIPLLANARDEGNGSEYRALLRARSARVRPRLVILGVVLALVAVGMVVLVAVAVLWVQALVAVSGLAVAAVAGRDPSRPLVDHAVLPGQVRKLSAGVVLRSFIAAKLCTEADPLTFATPIHRDSNGWRVVVDLPFGTTADQAMLKRGAVASGLDVDERQVFMSRVRGASGSARRLELWVADTDPLSVSAGRWPLTHSGRIDFWTGLPFGVDERGKEVPLCLVWAAMFVAGLPRHGKSFVARLVALAAALDPHVQIHIHDLKGGPDWVAFGQVAHRIFFGDRTDPDTGVDPVLALLDNVRDLLVEVDRRNRTLRSLPASIAPEGKLTPDLSRTKSAGMPLVLVVIDEIQRAFGHKTYGQELDEALTDLAKVGPSAGIMLLAASQKPDAKSTPTGFRDQLGVKFGLRVTTRDASEAVLGAGAYGEGLDCSKLSPEAKGCGLLRGTGDAGSVTGGRTVRTYFADGNDAEAVCLRGRALREKAGTLDGMAAGVVVTATPQTYSAAADLAVVLGSDEKAHSDVLCARLADRWPDRYAQWAPAQLSAALKPFGVRTKQVWAPSFDGQPANRYGVLRADLLAALDDPAD